MTRYHSMVRSGTKIFWVASDATTGDASCSAMTESSQFT